MDGARFDNLARQLAGRRTRRSVLRGLAGLVAGAIGLGASRTAEAACPAGQVAISGGRCVCKSTGRPPGPTGCPAGAGQTLCNGVAVDLSSDVNNCGTCGHACPASGQCMTPPICRAGMCLAMPLAAGTACNDGNLCTDNDQCNGQSTCIGTSKVCPGDQCNDGVCRQSDGACTKQPMPNGTTCNDGDACTRTDTCQNGQCVGGNPVVCQPLDSCHLAGQCDPSTGVCSNPPAAQGTACGAGASCTGGSQHLADTCNASETCVPGATTSCGLYVCTGTTCRTTCTDDTHCIGAAHCEGGACVNDGANGATCDGNGDCTSGICNTVSTICCSQACGAGVSCAGPNFTCTPACTPSCAGKACGASDDCGGTCQTGTCGAGQTCNAGICVGTTPNGQPCTTSGQCQSGFCNATSNFCCGQACASGVACGGAGFTCGAPTCGAAGLPCCLNEGGRYVCDAGLQRAAVGYPDFCRCVASCGADEEHCCLDDDGHGVSCGEGCCHIPFSGVTVCLCGGDGECCCPGDACDSGLTCSHARICVASCGGRGEACCGGDIRCDSGLFCSSAGRGCVECNPDGDFAVGGPCCSELRHGDHDIYCGPCGHLGEVCCVGDFMELFCLSGDLLCSSGRCVNCGGAGEPCCPSANHGDHCDSPDVLCNSRHHFTCEPCGEQGNICCPGDVCNRSDLSCQVGDCQPCGVPGRDPC